MISANSLHQSRLRRLNNGLKQVMLEGCWVFHRENYRHSGLQENFALLKSVAFITTNMKTYSNYWNRKSRDLRPVMAVIDQIVSFYLAIENDRRITTSHISIYMALFSYWNMNNGQNPIFINRS